MIPRFFLILLENGEKEVKMGTQKLIGYKWVTSRLHVGYTII